MSDDSLLQEICDNPMSSIVSPTRSEEIDVVLVQDADIEKMDMKTLRLSAWSVSPLVRGRCLANRDSKIDS